ncbi:MAG: sigma-70 family RNA polymerase sigma factor [Phycisphaerae bacterium]
MLLNAQMNLSDAPEPLEPGVAAPHSRAFVEQAHRRYAPGLLRFFARRLGGRAELADELAQHTWTALWEAVREGRYDSTRSRVSTFLYAIAYRVWLRHARSASSRTDSTDDFASQLLGLDGREDPARLAEGVELIDAMRHCLASDTSPDALTPEERAIVLGLAREQSERALSRTLKLAPSTIHERKKSAYQKLRDCLSRKGFSEALAERGELDRQ